MKKVPGRAKLGFGIVLLMGAMGLLGPLVSPGDPYLPGEPFLPPHRDHLLGTNDVGQDIFSELVYGARASLTVALSASAVAVGVGVLVGMVSGYYGGLVEDFLMGLADVALVVPGLPLLIVLAVYLGPSLWNIAVIIGLLWWGGVARVVRSRVLSIKSAGFVESSLVMGASHRWVLVRHVAPNLVPILLAKLVLVAAGAMVAEAGLSFVGLGDPTAKSWGTMLHFAFSRGGLTNGLWWWYLPPGLCISLSVLGLSYISFFLEEESDRRLRRALDR
ncbi:MAG: ABC transporter permease [Bacillota bacterium]